MCRLGLGLQGLLRLVVATCSGEPQSILLGCWLLPGNSCLGLAVSVMTVLRKPFEHALKQPHKWSQCWVQVGGPTAWLLMKSTEPPRWASLLLRGEWAGRLVGCPGALAHCPLLCLPEGGHQRSLEHLESQGSTGG